MMEMAAAGWRPEPADRSASGPVSRRTFPVRVGPAGGSRCVSYSVATTQPHGPVGQVGRIPVR